MNSHAMGTGAVYVIDGTDISFSSLADDQAEDMVSIYDIKLHLLTSGDASDLRRRRPLLSTERHVPP